MRTGSTVSVRPKWLGMLPRRQRFDVLLTSWLAERLPVASGSERLLIRSFLGIATKTKREHACRTIFVSIQLGRQNGTYRLYLHEQGIGALDGVRSLQVPTCPKLDALFRQSRPDRVEIMPDPLTSIASSGEASKGFPTKPMTQLVP